MSPFICIQTPNVTVHLHKNYVCHHSSVTYRWVMWGKSSINYMIFVSSVSYHLSPILVRWFVSPRASRAGWKCFITGWSHLDLLLLWSWSRIKVSWFYSAFLYTSHSSSVSPRSPHNISVNSSVAPVTTPDGALTRSTPLHHHSKVRSLTTRGGLLVLSCFLIMHLHFSSHSGFSPIFIFTVRIKLL